MSAQVRQIRTMIDELVKKLERAMRAEFPLGARISVMRNGSNRVGKVEGYTGYDANRALRVRMERTGQLLDIGLWENPEVLPADEAAR